MNSHVKCLAGLLHRDFARASHPVAHRRVLCCKAREMIKATDRAGQTILSWAAKQRKEDFERTKDYVTKNAADEVRMRKKERR